MHSRYANERTPSALQRISDMLINALPAHSRALHICKWAHFQRTPNTLLPHLNNCTHTPMHFCLYKCIQPISHSMHLVRTPMHCKYTHSNTLLFSEGMESRSKWPNRYETKTWHVMLPTECIYQVFNWGLKAGWKKSGKPGQRDGRMDGHNHDIIWPFFKWAYKKEHWLALQCTRCPSH